MILYEVYDPKTEILIAKGTASECAEQLGVTVKNFRGAVSRSRGGAKSRTYRIVEAGRMEIKHPNKKAKTEENISAAQAWDSFCEPIRKKYGIPVRRMKEGKA